MIVNQYHTYVNRREKPWKYERLAEQIREIIAEDECNDTYGRVRIYEALKLKYPDEKIPSERTVYRIMKRIGENHPKHRKSNGITKADREARKSNDLLKRDFTAEKPCEKCIADITEIPAKDGKLYVSAIFDCYDLSVLGISMADNMRAELCVETVANAFRTHSEIRGAILHSDRGSQYTSEKFRWICSAIGGIPPAEKRRQYYADSNSAV